MGVGFTGEAPSCKLAPGCRPKDVLLELNENEVIPCDGPYGIAIVPVALGPNMSDTVR